MNQPGFYRVNLRANAVDNGEPLISSYTADHCFLEEPGVAALTGNIMSHGTSGTRTYPDLKALSIPLDRIETVQYWTSPTKDEGNA